MNDDKNVPQLPRSLDEMLGQIPTAALPTESITFYIEVLYSVNNSEAMYAEEQRMYLKVTQHPMEESVLKEKMLVKINDSTLSNYDLSIIKVQKIDELVFSFNTGGGVDGIGLGFL